MKAISGISHDIRELRKSVDQGNVSARLAIETFTRSVKKIINGYAALMGELDSIAFTGSIGEHDIRTRLEVCDGLDSLGVRIDRQRMKRPLVSLKLISSDLSLARRSTSCLAKRSE